ncbi:MAG: cytochrome c [Ignavibacteria bacterium]|nr:cytochrome c [Ignavibacteria bacterium]
MNDQQRPKDELDFREIFKTPLRLFGYSYFYVLAVVLIVGLYYIQSLDTISRNAIQPSLPDSTLVVTDIPMKEPVNLPPVDIANISIPSPDLLNRGRQLYSGNCASCHDENGEGNGPAGAVFNPKPRNLTSDEGWVNARTISALYKTLDEGLLKTGMPSYNHLSPADRFALIHFVRSLGPDSPSDSPDELKALDASYNLSKGTRVAPQIPVLVASRKLVQESAGTAGKVASLLMAMDHAGTDAGAMMFRKVCTDRRRAATILASVDLRTMKKSDFTFLISASPAWCGFSESVVLLNSAEWDALYQYCTNLYQKIKS